jgi:hypothetical protein
VSGLDQDMERVRFRGWEVSADIVATRRSYLQIEQGVADTCRCAACRNFVLVREQFYPPEVRGLLERLGIDYRREIGLLYWQPDADEVVHYQGKHHFVGEIEVQTLTYRRVIEPFSVGFDNDYIEDTIQEAFGSQPVVQLEWYGPSPWVLSEPPPDRAHVEEAE